MTDGLDQYSRASLESAPHPPRYCWLRRVAFAAIAMLAIVPLTYWGCRGYTRWRLVSEVEQVRASAAGWLADAVAGPNLTELDDPATYFQLANDRPWMGPPGFEDADEFIEHCHPPGTMSESGYSRDAMEIFLEWNQTGVCLIRSGRSSSITPMPVRRRDSGAVFPGTRLKLSALRRLAKIAAIAGCHHALEGNHVESVESIRDVLALADFAASGVTLVDTLVAVAVSSLAANALEPLTPRIDSRQCEDARTLIAALSDETSLAQSVDRALRSGVLELFDKYEQIERGDIRPTDWLSQYLILSGGKFPTLGRSLDGYFMSVLAADFRRAVQATSHFADMANGGHYVKPASTPPFDRDTAPLLPRYCTFLSSSDRASLERALQLYFRAVAERRMAAIALAIRLYELDHGQRPSTLDALAPHYLPRLPADPFRLDGGTFGFIRAGRGARLYSVGKDQVDDGGEYRVHRGGRPIQREEADTPLLFLDLDRPEGAELAQFASPEKPAIEQPASSAKPKDSR